MTDEQWAARHAAINPHVDWLPYARAMRATGRRVCDVCDQWTPVTTEGVLAVHYRRDANRSTMVACHGSGTEATDA